MRWARGVTRERQQQTIECARQIKNVTDHFDRAVHFDALQIVLALVETREVFEPKESTIA